MEKPAFYLMLGVMAIFAFFSCNSTEESVFYDEQMAVVQSDERIERDLLILTSSDASKLAKRFASYEFGAKSRTLLSVGVKDVQVVISASGLPLIYVVNYVDNKGYIVISASKNYVPILAYSEKGYMDIKDYKFINDPFINEYKRFIDSVVNVQNDSLRRRYALDWSLFEKESNIVESRAYSDAEIQQKLEEARTYYGNLGYEVLPLSSASYLISAAGGQTGEQRADNFINDICMHTPSQYDCMDVTLLLVKRYDTVYGPYISTSWNQYAPYCTDASNGIAGCWTIATTQLMKYHEWPTSFNWSNIRSTLTEPLTIDEMNLMNLRREMDPTYESGQTGISIGKAQEMLQNQDYRVTQVLYPGYKSVASEIMAGYPVLMNGGDSINGGRHAWICDGYKYKSVQYAAYMIERNFEEYVFYSGMTDHYLTEYLHMNMGWEDVDYNKWYYYDTVLNYTEGRYILTVRPNK